MSHMHGQRRQEEPHSGRPRESSESRRESRQGVRGVAERVVGRVVKVCVEWPRESSGESSRCAWSGRESRRESRQGVRGVAERVVGRVVKVCVEWPRESSGESSRCAWSGRESRRESRHGVRGVAERVVGRVVTVCVEWPRESSGESSRCAWSGRESRHGVAERVVPAGRCMGRRLLDRGIELRLMVQLAISSWNGAVVRFPPDSEEGVPSVLTRLSSAARAELDGLRPGMDNVAPSSGADGRGLRPNKNYCLLRLWSLRPAKNTSSRATTGFFCYV